MAHYALLNNKNIVVNVITGVDENLTQTDLDGTLVGGTSENWEKFYESLPWFSGLKCKRTSYNAKIRGNFAGIGFYYDEVLDVFIPPKPFASWILDTNVFRWNPPIPKPNERNVFWNEELKKWEDA